MKWEGPGSNVYSVLKFTGQSRLYNLSSHINPLCRIVLRIEWRKILYTFISSMADTAPWQDINVIDNNFPTVTFLNFSVTALKEDLHHVLKVQLRS